jgi:hypothetical protein
MDVKKTILLRTFLLFALLSVATPSWAVEIRGSRSCGKWVKDREEKGWSGPANQTWLAGYLSGLAVGANIEFWNKHGNKLDNESVNLWMDNYCRANPLKSIHEGGYSLFIEHTVK